VGALARPTTGFGSSGPRDANARVLAVEMVSVVSLMSHFHLTTICSARVFTSPSLYALALVTTHQTHHRFTTHCHETVYAW
jgi:hypothetical protein